MCDDICLVSKFSWVFFKLRSHFSITYLTLSLVFLGVASPSSQVKAQTRSSGPMKAVAFGKLTSELSNVQRRSLLDNLPLRFEENVGQAQEPAKFLSRGGGYTLLLNPDGLALNLTHPNPNGAQSMRMHLVGARSSSPVGQEEAETRTSYYIGSDPSQWHLHVKSYKSVKYPNLYQGIDLVYHGTGNQLEYDFVIAPGANPRQIRMRFDGLRPVMKGKDLSVRVAEELTHSPGFEGLSAARWAEEVGRSSLGGSRRSCRNSSRII